MDAHSANSAPSTDAVAGLDRRLRWSPWSRCESSFGMLLVPSLPGVYVLAEQVLAPGEAPSLGEKRMLAVLSVASADDLAISLSRLFTLASPLRDRLMTSRCYIRYAVLPDLAQRQAVCAALDNWLSDAAAGLPMSAAPNDFGRERGSDRHAGVHPPSPLPAGF